jgi:hypothetical protein
MQRPHLSILQKNIRAPRTFLIIQVYKLILNGCVVVVVVVAVVVVVVTRTFYCSYYGYSMLHIARFLATRIVLESTLRKKGLPPDVEDMVLLGVVKTEKKTELLYMLQVPQFNKRSLNILQLAATMLGRARHIYFSHCMRLLNFFRSVFRRAKVNAKLGQSLHLFSPQARFCAIGVSGHGQSSILRHVCASRRLRGGGPGATV